MRSKGKFKHLGDKSRNQSCKIALEKAKKNAITQAFGQTISSGEDLITLHGIIQELKILSQKYYKEKDIFNCEVQIEAKIIKDIKTQIAKAEPTIIPKKKIKVTKVEDSTEEKFEKIFINFCVKVEDRHSGWYKNLSYNQKAGFMFPKTLKDNRCPAGFITNQNKDYYYSFIDYYQSNLIYLAIGKSFLEFSMESPNYGGYNNDPDSIRYIKSSAKIMSLPTICYNYSDKKVFVVDKTVQNCNLSNLQNFSEIIFDGENYFIEKITDIEIAKVEEPKQEEFKPENKDVDNDAPVIEIAQNIIVDSQTYTLKGKVKDKSRFFLTIDDRPIEVAKNGQFEFEGFAIDSKEQLKIVAIDRWKNKSEKIINVEVKLKQVADLRSYEKPNPSKIKVKKDNNKIGIIIGIEKYQNLNNIDAPYANRDAKAFKAYANIALGIPSNNLKVLIDEDATRGELLKSLKIWLPQITRGEKKDIYIFFAGHGLASDNGEDLHILPHNGDPVLLEDTALSRIEMFDLINKVNPKSVTMFFDTCYSGQTRSEQMLIAGLRPVRIVADEQDTPNNFTIFTASNYDQTSGSINEAEHGIFSYYLMKGLEGKADENSDKKITNGELISYLKNNVTQEAFSQNRSQEPMLSGDPDKVLISYR